jgi:hypothetical protein
VNLSVNNFRIMNRHLMNFLFVVYHVSGKVHKCRCFRLLVLVEIETKRHMEKVLIFCNYQLFFSNVVDNNRI